MELRIRWNAVGIGFLATAVGILVASPLLARIGLQVSAGPVDMLTMVSILIGGCVAGRLSDEKELIQGAMVGVLYVFVILLSRQTFADIRAAKVAGAGLSGQLDSWGYYGKTVFYLIAGTLGGVCASALRARKRASARALLRTTGTVRRKSQAAATQPPVHDDESAR
jgi:putative membrane protein (TIGR04086 family)